MRNDFENNYLAHHGILGMKWGKKNGPPYPLDASDHSAAEKKAGWRKSLGGGRNEEDYASERKQKKNAKEVIKTYGKDSSKIRDKIKEKVDDISNSKLDSLYKDFREKADASVSAGDFWDSKEFEEATKKAYDETFKWFESNRPDYLKEIIEKNKGEKAGLDTFHDFRKVNEGYEDEFWSKAEQQYNKNNKEAKRLEKEADKAYDAWVSESKRVTNSILGKYGDQPISKFNTDVKLNDIVRRSIEDETVARYFNKK